LQSFGAAANGWDGLDARAPSKNTIAGAMQLANVLRAAAYPVPTIMLGGGGTVLFIWEDGPVYLDAEVISSSHARWMQVIEGQRSKHWVLNEFTLEGLEGMGQSQIPPTPRREDLSSPAVTFVLRPSVAP
jgi:hypothetical protein